MARQPAAGVTITGVVLGAPVHAEFRRAPDGDEDDTPTIVFLTIGKPDTPLVRGGHPQMLALIDFRRHVLALDVFDGHERSKSTLNHLAFEIPPERHEAEHERLEAMGRATCWSSSATRPHLRIPERSRPGGDAGQAVSRAALGPGVRPGTPPGGASDELVRWRVRVLLRPPQGLASQIEHVAQGRALPAQSSETRTRCASESRSRPMTPRSNALW